MDSMQVARPATLVQYMIRVFILNSILCPVALITAENIHNELHNIELKNALTILQIKSLLDLYEEKAEVQASLTASCNEQLHEYAKGIRRAEIWALKMLDSSSNIPPGVLEGNLRDVGNYDECAAVKTGENGESQGGRHCTYFLKIRGLNELELPSFALCLPVTCDSSAVEVMLENAMTQNLNFSRIGIDYKWPSCSQLRPRNYSTEFYVASAVLGALLFLELLITACDVANNWLGTSSPFKSIQGLFKYSMYTNGIQIFHRRTSRSAFPAIDGLRVIAMSLVMIFHASLSGVITPNINPRDIFEFQSSWLHAFIMIPTFYAVETFFVISAFLTSFNFVKDTSKGKSFNLPFFYLRRYLRLTPSLLATIFGAIILSNIGSGPRWDINMDIIVNSCRECYWSILFYVHNITSPYNLCLAHVWSLAVDMQLYFFAPIILHVLVRSPKLGYTLLGLVALSSIVLQGVIISNQKIPTIFSYNRSIDEMHTAFAYVYKMPYTRVGSYCFGLLFGYLVAMERLNLRRVHVSLGSLTAVLCFLFNISFSMIFVRKDYEYNAVWEVLYNCVSYPAWGFAVAWIIYISVYDEKGFLARFLSSPIFVPLSRISYCFYLTHLSVPFFLTSGLRTVGHWNFFYEVIKMLAYYMLSLILAFFVTVVIEVPALTLLRLYRHKN